MFGTEERLGERMTTFPMLLARCRNCKAATPRSKPSNKCLGAVRLFHKVSVIQKVKFRTNGQLGVTVTVTKLAGFSCERNECVGQAVFGKGPPAIKHTILFEQCRADIVQLCPFSKLQSSVFWGEEVKGNNSWQDAC